MQDRLFSKLSMARRAGMLTYGYDSVKEAVEKGKASLVIIASDLSPKTVKETEFFCKDKATVIRTDKTMSDFQTGIGVMTGIVTLTDQGFTKAVRSILEVE